MGFRQHRVSLCHFAAPHPAPTSRGTACRFLISYKKTTRQPGGFLLSFFYSAVEELGSSSSPVTYRRNARVGLDRSADFRQENITARRAFLSSSL